MDEAELILGIETSAGPGGLALLRDDEVVETLAFSGMRRQAAELVAGIERLLAHHGYRPPDVAGLAVSVGPGSFTGLRVALSAAKLFCWALNRPLIPVGSLEALAHEAWNRERPDVTHVIACREAYSGQVYTHAFAVREGRLQAGGGPQINPPQQAAATVPSGQPLLLVGDGLQHLRQHVASDVQALWHDRHICAEAVTVARLGRLALHSEAFASGEDVHAVAPLYLRPSAAEQQTSE